MKRLFVSVPMKGRTEEAILNSIAKMHVIAEAMTGEKLELINSYMPKAAENKTKAEALRSLGDSIKYLADADVCIGFGWCGAMGCEVEMTICRNYGITYLELDGHRCSFMDDYYEALRREQACSLNPVVAEEIKVF